MRAAVPFGVLAAAFSQGAEQPPSPFYPYYESDDGAASEVDYEATFIAVAQHLERFGYTDDPQPAEPAGDGESN